MANYGQDERRSLGLLGATNVGVGAIVGGGIMVLAGVAFANTGPAALVAFALNGLVAFITAMSFAEMSTAFPQSGGAYTFAKKVLSVRAAFAVGWILWFAYIVAGVLYALGFAAFAAAAMQNLWATFGDAPPWLTSRRMLLLLACSATIAYALSLIRKSTGGGQWATKGKVILFAFIILAGVIGVARQPLSHTTGALTPFFSGGASGLFAAMGFTFIALQGFDLIPAIASEVKDPGKTIPRSMFLSLAIALGVYLPLLFVVSAAGVEPGGSISQLATEQGDTVFALAVSRFLGTPGYWLVIIAAILSTLSALHANLLAASRVALSMAQDRTLPVVLGTVHAGRKTPVMAIYATALTVVAITFMIPDLGAAGAAASLIFLISFTLTHITTYLARVRRKQATAEFRTPWFPLVPVAGGLACGCLAIFQAVLIPDAGGVVLIWLALGVILYIALFKHSAETADASAEALDPSLAKLRGKNPLVLLPIANPGHARSMVAVANAMAPTEFARVLLLTIVATSKNGDRDEILAKLEDAQSVVREALGASYADGQAPEAMITTASDPWAEIRRVAELHNCQSIVLGFGDSVKSILETNAENLLNQVDCDVAIIRAANDWQLDKAERILVPVGGRGHEHEFRARVLGSVCRDRPREVTFVTVLKTGASDNQAAETLRDISSLAEVNVPGAPKVVILRNDDPAAALIEEASKHDLLILGLKSVRWGRKVIGELTLRIARESPCAVIMLSSRRSRAYSELYRPIRDAVHVLPWLSPDTPQSNTGQ